MPTPLFSIAVGGALALFAFARTSGSRALRHKLRALQIQSIQAKADRQRFPENLPVPVKRYLEIALGDHPDDWRIKRATLQQYGELRTSTRTKRWMRFAALHCAAGAQPGFVWIALIKAAPLVKIRVIDSYLQGRGSGKVHLYSAIPVASASDCPEMNSGALHRYLAEAVWYPTALLPGPCLCWSAIDDRRALARMTDGENSVELEFHFGLDGLVERIYTPARWGSFDGGFRQERWEGHFADYIEVQGIKVPSRGEVGWYDRDQWECVWRGQVVDASYEVEIVER